MKEVVVKMVTISIMMLMIMQCSHGAAVGGPRRVPAMFVFGDSLVDVGNNNFLTSLAKADYYPYGCDFSSGPTGRFTNGETFVDMLGNFLHPCYCLLHLPFSLNFYLFLIFS